MGANRPETSILKLLKIANFHKSNREPARSLNKV